MSRLAVLLATHNRQAFTLRCLRDLCSQTLPPGLDFQVYLVDDASQDGTPEAVAREFPQVRILRGNGKLFWCRGMREAWRAAVHEDPDFYLLLNDDTFLLPQGIQGLFDAWSHPHAWPENSQPDKIVVGSCRDPQTGQRSYGGQRRPGLHPGRLVSIVPSAQIQSCDTFEANLVLIPRAAYLRLGMLDDFSHAMADTDYGLRAKKAGVPMVVAPSYLAVCQAPARTEKSSGMELPPFAAMRARLSRKSLPPGDWLRFCWRHAGLCGLGFWFWTYLSPWVRSSVRALRQQA